MSVQGHIRWAGFWRHYKGGRYVITAIAETHEHNGDLDVVYISCTYGKCVTRPLWRDSRQQDAWLDDVKWPDGVYRQRFVREAEYEEGYFERMFFHESDPKL